jgi:hypothetical protein
MTNQQLYLAIGVPVLFYGALILLLAYLILNQRIRDLRDQLRSVEERHHARLKHLEEDRH